jgi:transketolase
MRTAFVETLQELAALDDRVELVVGDLGFGVVEPFAERFPDRFHNAGVAEQNMTGLATGLALAGSVVFTYSIGNFPTLRCLEQIRNDVCYHNANVKVVAVGGGLTYGVLGASHHATEDLAILRTMPNLLVAAPGDPVEVRAVTREVHANEGPAYLRLGKAHDPTVHAAEIHLPPGSSVQLRPGDDVALLVTGAMLPVAMDVARLLEAYGIDSRIVSFPWLFPFDESAVLRAGHETAIIVSIEEHSMVGGLGSAVAEVLAAESHARAPLVRIGLPRTFTSAVGDQKYLREVYGLDPDAIASRILALKREQDGLARPFR